ncbi:uncharacterized protein LOC101853422 [Aplysia californica]|uniref:Uncharacterized protein LOC101853422 n=1 Tax=Aplysia californica TaxID=6500 RepID=A0ABM0ZXZ1_APLCA|nr:uncharacterized protein LOC101853422 [Aplysia californica]
MPSRCFIPRDLFCQDINPDFFTPVPDVTNRVVRIQVSPEGSTRTTSQSNLAVKGKNVWALSLESERHGRLEMATAEVKIPSRPQEKTQAAGASVCRHRKLRHMCQVCCDNWVGTPTAPPKKKHCRSLSVPPEGPVSLPTPGKEPGAKIWRPIAVIPLSNSATDSKDRDFVYPSNAMSAMVCPPFNESSVTTGKWLPRLTSSGGFVKLLPPKSSASSPSVPSSPSVDSGHFTTSDLQTPPGSPVPRPASAASSDTSSFSSLGSPWLEYSPLRGPRVRVLENRSLSLEDRISGSASSAASTPSFHSGFDPSHRCRSSSSQDGAGEGCGEVGGGPCGGLGGIIPRCHSQPCVLHHRRCGKKRRRDCDNRPNLNFNKMTERWSMVLYLAQRQLQEKNRLEIGEDVGES